MGGIMKFDLAVINWQAVASLLTFVAVAIALWSVNVQRREAKARAGHLLKMMGVSLIAFMSAFRAHLEENASSQDIKLTPPLRELLDELLRLFKDAFIVMEPKRYGPLSTIVADMAILKAHDSFTTDVGADLLQRIEVFLTNKLIAPEIGPSVSREWGRARTS